MLRFVCPYTISKIFCIFQGQSPGPVNALPSCFKILTMKEVKKVWQYRCVVYNHTCIAYSNPWQVGFSRLLQVPANVYKPNITIVDYLENFHNVKCKPKSVRFRKHAEWMNLNISLLIHFIGLIFMWAIFKDKVLLFKAFLLLFYYILIVI